MRKKKIEFKLHKYSHAKFSSIVFNFTDLQMFVLFILNFEWSDNESI